MLTGPEGGNAVNVLRISQWSEKVGFLNGGARFISALERTLGVTMYFSEIIKLQFGEKMHALFCILRLCLVTWPWIRREARGDLVLI